MTLRPNEVVRLQMAVSATGNGNIINVNGLAAVAFQVVGTFVATVTFEGTIDGANWVSLKSAPQGGGPGVTTATAAGIWLASCAGLAQVRARVTWVSGTSVTVLAMGLDEAAAGAATWTSDTTHLGQVGGHLANIRVEKTRPNNTTAYVANDAINESASAGTNWTFAAARTNGPGSGVVVAVQIQTDHAAGTAVLELDLYDSSITAINDHAEATHLYANVTKFLQTVILPALAKKTSASTMAEALTPCAVPFVATDLTNLTGIVRTPAGFTPLANAKYTVTLFCAQD